MKLFEVEHPSLCPLCGGTGLKRVKGIEYYGHCDHTYLSYRGKVIATGNYASILLGAILAGPICIILMLIRIFLL